MTARVPVSPTPEEKETLATLLIEALARIQAMDRTLGDPGGPRHPADYWDTERLVRWVEPLAVEPPAWTDDESAPGYVSRDPLENVWPDDHPAWAQIDARADELRQRVRDEDKRYQERVLAGFRQVTDKPEGETILCAWCDNPARGNGTHPVAGIQPSCGDEFHGFQFVVDPRLSSVPVVGMVGQPDKDTTSETGVEYGHHKSGAAPMTVFESIEEAQSDGDWHFGDTLLERSVGPWRVVR